MCSSETGSRVEIEFASRGAINVNGCSALLSPVQFGSRVTTIGNGAGRLHLLVPLASTCRIVSSIFTPKRTKRKRFASALHQASIRSHHLPLDVDLCFFLFAAGAHVDSRSLHYMALVSPCSRFAPHVIHASTMPIEVILRRGFPHQPLTAKPHTRLSDPGAKSQPEDGPTLGRAFARFSHRPNGEIPLPALCTSTSSSPQYATDLSLHSQVDSTLLSLSFSCRSAPSGLARLSPERRTQLALTLHCRRSTALAGTCILPNVTLRMLGTFYQLHGLFPRAPKSSASAGSVGADPPHRRNKPANQLSSVSHYGATVSSWRHNSEHGGGAGKGKKGAKAAETGGYSMAS
ncbi:hypothetical protein J3E69DRAFT_359699 [Trichoderma sp. SZMC 28015]